MRVEGKREDNTALWLGLYEKAKVRMPVRFTERYSKLLRALPPEWHYHCTSQKRNGNGEEGNNMNNSECFLKHEENEEGD